MFMACRLSINRRFDLSDSTKKGATIKSLNEHENPFNAALFTAGSLEMLFHIQQMGAFLLWVNETLVFLLRLFFILKGKLNSAIEIRDTDRVEQKHKRPKTSWSLITRNSCTLSRAEKFLSFKNLRFASASDIYHKKWHRRAASCIISC